MENTEIKIGMRVKWQDITKVRYGVVEAIGGFTIGHGIAGKDIIILPDEPTEREVKRFGAKTIEIAGMLSLA